MTKKVTEQTYRRLGDYIHEVDVRNKDGVVKLSQGICNQKYFQDPKQVSATPAADKIVRTGQFAYNRATTRNGDKISIALRVGPDCTVSSAYCVFEVVDTNVIEPHWLWLWFKRPEFDRYAIFKSHGSAHEFFEFETLCNTFIDLPPIEEQREIVARHQAIERRIEINRKTIARLEEAAQAIYRKMFVDGIDTENLPDGWEKYTFGAFAESNSDNLSAKDKFETIRYYETSVVTNNVFDDPQILHIGIDEIPSRAKRKVKYNDILYSTVRPNLRHYGLLKDDSRNNIVSTGFAVIRSKVPYISNELLFLFLTSSSNTQKLQELADMSKATYPSITVDDILNLPIILPSLWTDELIEAQSQIITIYNHIAILIKETKMLYNFIKL